MRAFRQYTFNGFRASPGIGWQRRFGGHFSTRRAIGVAMS
jgi:hypothetical protein